MRQHLNLHLQLMPMTKQPSLPQKKVQQKLKKKLKKKLKQKNLLKLLLRIRPRTQKAPHHLKPSLKPLLPPRRKQLQSRRKQLQSQRQLLKPKRSRRTTPVQTLSPIQRINQPQKLPASQRSLLLWSCPLQCLQDQETHLSRRHAAKVTLHSFHFIGRQWWKKYSDTLLK